MKPGHLDLPTIWRGCDWPVVVLQWKDQDGNPIDLTGFTPKAFTRNGYNLNAVISDFTGGVTQMIVNSSQTASMKLGTDSWDWIWERADGSYRFPPFLSGSIPVKEPITQT